MLLSLPVWLGLTLVIISLTYVPVPPLHVGVVPVFTLVQIGDGRPSVDVRLNLTSDYAIPTVRLASPPLVQCRRE